MMSIKNAAFAFLLLGAASSSGLSFTFSSYKASSPREVNMPALPDSIDKENAFKAAQLFDLSQHNPYAAAGWTTLVPEADGRMRLAGPAGKPTLHTYYTRLRSPKFIKGKLELSSPTRARVSVNDEVKIKKEDSDSTAKQASEIITLLPQTDYDIFVDILQMPGDSSSEGFTLRYIPEKDFENINVTASSEAKGRVSQATAIFGERVSDTSLSADGRYLIVKSREIISDKETSERAQLFETSTGNPINENLDVTASWVPGRAAYVTTKERNGKYDVFITDLTSMKTSLFAKDIPDKDFVLTPDGNRLLYYKKTEGPKEEGTLRRYRNPDDRMPGDRDRMYIMCYDTRDKTTATVTFGGPSTYINDISRKGDKLLYTSTRQTPDKYPFYSSSLVEVDLFTLKTDTLAADFRQTLADAVYSPDADKVFVIAGPDAFGGIGANYAPHKIGNDYDYQGYILDIASKTATAVTKSFNPSISKGDWNPADGKIYFLGETGFYQYIYRLNPKDGKIIKIDTEVPYVRNFSLSPDNNQWLSYTGGSFTQDGEGYLLNLKTDKSRLISAPLRTLTGNVEFGQMEPWQFTAGDGTVVDGYMCLPPEFDPSKKYPLIVYYYGGTSPSNATFYHNYSPQVFASRDYVVYIPNPSGTTGYGQEFSARHVNAWGKRTAEEIIEGTKEFCKSHPFVDDKKIGCIGASYGGFMTMYLQTLTDIFSAAVSHAGISNVASYWGEGYWGYSYNTVAAARSYPWNNPELFTKQGALFNADKIHTPILLLHGSEDTNVPIGESIQLFNALKILGREVEFISVQGENHVIKGVENRLSWQNTIMAWFEKYLKDNPSWWNSLYKD